MTLIGGMQTQQERHHLLVLRTNRWRQEDLPEEGFPKLWYHAQESCFHFMLENCFFPKTYNYFHIIIDQLEQMTGACNFLRYRMGEETAVLFKKQCSLLSQDQKVHKRGAVWPILYVPGL